MKNLVVGGEGCSINSIVLGMGNINNAWVLTKEWRKLARELDTPNERIHERGKDLDSNRREILDVVSDLLLDWKSRVGNEAKFEKLLNVLELGCRWKDISDNLWQTFLATIPENTCWDDLDTRSQNKIMESRVEYQGQLQSLKNICNMFNDSEMVATLQRKMSGPTILKLLRGEQISLVTAGIPEIPLYYIPRKLHSRRALNPKVFKHKCTDIFVVQGIDLSDLSDLAENECAAKASQQLEKLTSRFILLDFPKGFEMITKLAKCVPVHQLHYCSIIKMFYWVQTFGNISLIQEYAQTSQTKVSEDEFLLLNEDKHHNKNLPVCIADIPGMGKTCLLASLARQRAAHVGSDSLLLFITLNKFIGNIDKITEQDDVCQDNVCNWISEHVSQNELGHHIVSKMLCSEFHKVEIFFDGYDELSVQKQKLTTTILKFLIDKDKFKNVHVTITTREHKRRELERELKVLSYNITPFEKCDQNQFFVKYWHKMSGVPICEKLERFANFVVQHVRETLSSTECDVVGIPLQCSMLAELFETDAVRYSKTDAFPLELSITILSVHQMHMALMSKRFGMFTEDKQAYLKEYHVFAAIRAVFPKFLAEFDEENTFEFISLNEVNSVGILIAEKDNMFVKVQFLHHSYAEYILANFLVGQFGSVGGGRRSELEGMPREEIFKEALSLSEDDPEVLVNTPACYIYDLWKRICNLEEADALGKDWTTLAINLDMSDYTQDVIGGKLKYYINQNMSEWQDPLYLILHQWTQKLKAHPQLRQLLVALRSAGFTKAAEELKSAYHRPAFKYKNICYFMNGCLQHENMPIPLNTSKLLAYDHDDGTLVNSILSACLYHNFSSLFALFTHHCLSIKNNNIQSHVYNETNFSHLLLIASKHSSVTLVAKCYDFLESIQECDQVDPVDQVTTCFKTLNTFVYTPLHAAAQRGDFTIFDYLFKKFGRSIHKLKYLLHSCVQFSLTNSEDVIKDKIQIITMMVKINKECLNEKDHERRRTAMLMPYVHLKLLQHIIGLGADIKVVSSDNGDTVVHKTATYLCPSDFHTFTEFLLEKGAVELFNARNIYRCTPLHYAFECIDVKPETIQLLSTHLGNGSFNTVDKQGNNALFYAVAGHRKKVVLEMIVKCGVNSKLLRVDKQSIIHLAAIFGNLEALSYFISLGCNVNARDIANRTPLHLAFLLGRRNLDGVVQLLMDKGAKANMKDVYGEKAIFYAKVENKLGMLEQSTKDVFVKASEEKASWIKLLPSVPFQRGRRSANNKPEKVIQVNN